jgi:hypothetical protein
VEDFFQILWPSHNVLGQVPKIILYSCGRRISTIFITPNNLNTVKIKIVKEFYTHLPLKKIIHILTRKYLNFNFKVPGRLGLLITLDLIATNTYNSVKAPEKRGFSYLEIWMLGVQIPILLAIFEYGILLAIKRMYKNESEQNRIQVRNVGKKLNVIPKRTWDLEKIGRKMDKWTFSISLTFIILFNIIYWAMAQRSQYN